MGNKISFKSLNKFDRDYLKKNLYFSLRDKDGNERIHADMKEDNTFNTVITGITQEIIRRLDLLGISSVPTYSINQFVLALGDSEKIVSSTIKDVISDFINGATMEEGDDYFEDGFIENYYNPKTKEELHKIILENFTENEIRMINPKIYSNKEHIEYYKKYHTGDYTYCINFLFTHRDLLK
jgi:hypothetical protein